MDSFTFCPVRTHYGAATLLLFLFTTNLISQTNASSTAIGCGEYFKNRDSKKNTANNDDQIYVDRFGNTFSRDEVSSDAHAKATGAGCTNPGYFHLTVEGGFTPAEEATICAVFTYVSTIIPAQSPNAYVGIHIVKEAFINPQTGGLEYNVAGAASPILSKFDCGIASAAAWAGIYGVSNGGIDHGYIRLNANLNWHAFDPANPATEDVPANAIDLYSVALHEALHLFGIASAITTDAEGNGASIVGSVFSRWDTYLFSETANLPLLKHVGGNGACCDQHAFDNDHFDMPTDIGQGCASNIVFRSNDVALGRISALPGQSTVNTLSHIPDACNGGHHLMNPFIMPGEKRRAPQPDELAILCALGMPVTSGCTTASCGVFAKDDGVLVVEQAGNYVFSASSLTANDVFPAGATFSFEMTGSDVPATAYQINGNELTINTNNLAVGLYHLQYAIHGCGNQCDGAEVTFLVRNDEKQQCCYQNTGCNINCLGNMESFTSNADMRMKLCQCPMTGEGFCTFHTVANNIVNSPDLVTATGIFSMCSGLQPASVPVASGQKMLYLGVVNQTPRYWEAVAFPLCESILPGDKVDVRFLATKSCPNYNMKARIEFLTTAPVPGEIVYTTPGISGGPYYVPLQSAYNSTPKFTQHQLNQLENTTSQPWNYLLLSTDSDNQPGTILGSFYDNVEVNITRSFSDRYTVSSAVSPARPCLSGVVTIDYAICNTTTDQMHALSMEAVLPAGLTFLPSLDFPTQTISLPEAWLLPGECKHLKLTVQVDDNQLLLGQTLPVVLKASGANTGCWVGENVSSNVRPLGNSLSLSTGFQEDAASGILTFSLTISNSYVEAIPDVEVKDVVAAAFTLVDNGDFTQIGSTLVQTITVPASGQITLHFTARRNCACGPAQNCGIVRIKNGGCGDVVHCDVIPGILTPPQTAIAIVPQANNCHAFSFAAVSTNECNTYLWNFGDGQTSTAANPMHEYVQSADFNVTLAVTNACGTVTYTSVAHVQCLPPAGFSCPCTGAGALNVDASGQNQTNLSILATPLSGQQPQGFAYNNSGKCIAIKGELVVDNNFQLTISGGEIKMQPGAKITVKSGASLILNDINQGNPLDDAETGIHGCRLMWRGIVVEPGASLTMSGAKIQDAEFAVDIKGDVANPPSFSAVNCDFNRNYVGIRAAGKLTQPFSLQNNHFRSTGTLLAASNGDVVNWNAQFPYAGIDLTRTIFSLGDPENAASGNSFSNLQNGIIAYRAVLSVYYGSFSKIWGSVGFNVSPQWTSLQGVGIAARGQSLTVHDVAFNAESFNGWRAISVADCNLDAQRNEITDLQSGIYVTPGGASSVFISENKFKVTLNEWSFGQAAFVVSGPAGNAKIDIVGNNPVQVRGQGPAIWLVNNGNAAEANKRRVSGNLIYRLSSVSPGISLENSGNWTVDGNHVFCSGFSPAVATASGIRLSVADNCYLRENEVVATEGDALSNNMNAIEVAGSDHNTLCCNTTNNTLRGQYFVGNCMPTYLRHNRLYNHSIGLLCDGVGTMIGAQEWGGNQWMGAYNQLGALHTGDLSNIENSKFYQEGPQTTGGFWPPNCFPETPNSWFVEMDGVSQECGSTDTLCPLLAPALNSPRQQLTENEQKTLSGDFAGANAYNQTSQLEAERNLFREMQQNETLIEKNRDLGQFFEQAATSVKGQLNAVENEMSAAEGPVVAQFARVQAIDQELNSASARRISTKNTDNQYALLEEWIALSDRISQEKTGQAAELLAFNNGLSAATSWENNRKRVNSIYLETIAMGNFTASESQLAALREVAGQCMLEGGEAVLQARALYNNLAAEPLAFSDAQLCQIGEQTTLAAAQTPAAGGKIFVSPNPAQDEFAVFVEKLPKGAALHLQIFNATGSMEKEMDFINGASANSQLMSGMYVCRIFDGDTLIGVEKLIIVL